MFVYIQVYSYLYISVCCLAPIVQALLSFALGQVVQCVKRYYFCYGTFYALVIQCTFCRRSKKWSRLDANDGAVTKIAKASRGQSKGSEYEVKIKES